MVVFPEPPLLSLPDPPIEVVPAPEPVSEEWVTGATYGSLTALGVSVEAVAELPVADALEDGGLAERAGALVAAGAVGAVCCVCRRT